MALKTNFTDDILAESMNGKRQYNVTENSNGTKSLEDVTDYQSVGSTFSAKDMNETNAAVNQAYDDMGDEFNPEVDYAVGDYTIRNNKVWKFTTAHPAGAWDESHVKATKILSEARELTEKLEETWNSRNILLWENPNIKTSFTAQTITLSDSLDNYSYFEIYLTLGINNSNIENGYSKFIISDEFTRFDVMNNNTNELYYRIITRDLRTPNKLTISNAYTGNAYTGSIFIPYKIYGIK